VRFENEIFSYFSKHITVYYNAGVVVVNSEAVVFAAGIIAEKGRKMAPNCFRPKWCEKISCFM
jgi:dTDP-4-amino-4,6-dideoxygalactose transaminase